MTWTDALFALLEGKRVKRREWRRHLFMGRYLIYAHHGHGTITKWLVFWGDYEATDWEVVADVA